MTAPPGPQGPLQSPPMTKPLSPVIDAVLEHNKRYAEQFSLAGLPIVPSKRLAVVSCMDARIDPITSLGLAYGEAHILRNAGGVVTPDMHRSLIVSTQKLDTREIMIINHTGCGMLKFRGADFFQELEDKYGPSSDAPERFFTFADLDANVREQLRRIQSCRWIHPEVVARGFVYDMETGLLREVEN